MEYSDFKKNQYWNHFMVMKSYWPQGFTRNRLNKVKEIIWNDNNFWDDILLRHGAYDKSPSELSDEIYQHLFGNFAGMLSSIMHEKKIIK
jgi:hypothetical protein